MWRSLGLFSFRKGFGGGGGSFVTVTGVMRSEYTMGGTIGTSGYV